MEKPLSEWVDLILRFYSGMSSLEEIDKWVYESGDTDEVLGIDGYFDYEDYEFSKKYIRNHRDQMKQMLLTALKNICSVHYEKLDAETKVICDVILSNESEKMYKLKRVCIENKKISKLAMQMLSEGKLENALTNTEVIIKLFQREGIPIFEKVINFQEIYGGIWYKIGKGYYKGYHMNIFYFDSQILKYRFKYWSKDSGKYFFQCMDYHYAGDIGPCIDEDGKIYNFFMGTYKLRADSIEEFLEDESIKYYFVNMYPKWINSSITNKQFNDLQKNVDFIKIESSHYTDKYFEWWKDVTESIFIRIDLLSKYEYIGDIYCRDNNIIRSCLGISFSNNYLYP
ncbi:hypothetical protein [Pseudobacteroides cellulosolvens]|uniref:Uncharacterized protein n=1 Tax=Pseudobacteroides cellulosolvens ATCC 35603 = DSM 2933 TaxID=398512 RepID=A0A0L6JRB0_9FIRM|nr:hypothetical protein [Pseudobacteroides cellulosolvens]KNY28318.1 hypothetical protein Bccel_3592 [Pseudobacteroides cellulosolvens ATCC 35603 = DSM 2933]